MPTSALPSRTATSIDIAHTADLHLGYTRSGAMPAHERFEQLVKAIIAQAPDVWVIAGDVFHRRDPAASLMAQFERAVARAKDKDIEVVVSAGNHDARRTGESALPELAANGGFHLLMEQGHVDLAVRPEEGLRVHGLPYYALAAHCDGSKPLADFEIGRCANVLAAHGDARGANIDVPPGEVELPADLVRHPAFPLVMLGHVPQHVQVDPDGCAFYAGTLAPMGTRHRAADSYWHHRLQARELVGSCSVPFTARARAAGLNAPAPRPTSPDHLIALAYQMGMTPAELALTDVMERKAAV